MTREPRILTAEWRRLAMLNYEIDPSLLAGDMPAGCELDSWPGHTFVSVVGFEFLHTRILGVSIPFHRHFEEVNLQSCSVMRVSSAPSSGSIGKPEKRTDKPSQPPR